MKKKLIGAGVFVAALLLIFVAIKLHRSSVVIHPVRVQKQAVAVRGPSGFEAQFKEAMAIENKGELLAARDAYKNLILAYSSKPDIEGVQKRLDDLNMRIIFSAINVPNQTTIREVKEGDSLSMIADEFRTTSELIKRENGLHNDVIRMGQRLRIWTGRFSVLVDKSQNTLTLKSDADVIKTFSVSTGKDNITPTGVFKIVNKLINPSWTHDGQLIPAGDKRNILGTRWLGFNIPSYGIHGTTAPESIGTQATAGCVRMINNEVELLYDILPVNTEVTITD